MLHVQKFQAQEGGRKMSRQSSPGLSSTENVGVSLPGFCTREDGGSSDGDRDTR